MVDEHERLPPSSIDVQEIHGGCTLRVAGKAASRRNTVSVLIAPFSRSGPVVNAH